MTSAGAEFAAPPFPWPVRGVLGLWHAAARFGIGIPALDEASLMAAARRRSGLSRIEDEDSLLPMRKLLDSLEHEANLHMLGRAIMRNSLIRNIETRFRLENFVDLNPEIADCGVEQPIFIAGLQRTGTTKLHRLLSLDPRLRELTAAEALNPAPLGRPIRMEQGELARRVAIARRAEKALRYLSPSLFAIHPIEAEAPEEDVFLLDVAFINGAVDASLDVPSYSEWLREVDQTDAYRYVRRLIGFLCWQRPGRYLGKTPHHLANLDALFASFPDAKVIQTHRDPLRVVPSFSSMMGHAGAMLTHDVDAERLGRRVLDQMVGSVTRAMASRDRGVNDSVLDVHYENLMGDPLKEIRRIYDFVELEFDARVERAMQNWMLENPKDKNGPHRYRLQDFGLEPDEVEARFEGYRNRFGVSREPDA